MKILLIFFVINILSVLSIQEIFDYEKEFADWMRKFHKCYTDDEVSKRFGYFMKELTVMFDQNKKFEANISNFRAKLNHGSADSPEEEIYWRGLTKCGPEKHEAIRGRTVQPRFNSAPTSIDFRDFGYVTDPEDQGYCGSCYAFASLCALEGQIAKKYGILNSLSKQQIVDCSSNPSGGNWGCDGGYAEQTFNYVGDVPGVDHDSDYPYIGEQGTCQYKDSGMDSRIGYNRIYGDEENLIRALAAVGPMIVGIKADLDTFYGYGDGVFDDPECRGGVNHAVCLIGFGTDYTMDTPMDYWIIKNSWSTYWGENGYMRVQRGENRCNISDYVIYPILHDP